MIILFVIVLTFTLIMVGGIFVRSTYVKKKTKKANLDRLLSEVQIERRSNSETFTQLTDTFDRRLMQYPSLRNIFNKFQNGNQSVHQIKPAHIVLLNLGMLLLAYNLSNIFHISFLTTILVVLISEIVALYFVMRNQKKLRDVFEAELPAILDTLSRVYKVHPDLKIAIREVCRHIKEPVVREKFENVLKLSRFGYTTEEALFMFAKEIQSDDLEFVVTSIHLNTPLGGNLSNQFERIADILRKRKSTSNEIKNVMFMNKASTMITMMFVPIIGIISFTFNPEAKKHLIESPSGRLIFFACIAWWLIGIVLTRRVTRIKL